MSVAIPLGFVAVNKLSKEYKDTIKLTSYQTEAIHGLMLGDLHASRAKVTHNTRLQFDQGDVHTEYVHHLYALFLSIINQSIHTVIRKPDLRTGKIYISLMFKTLALPCLNIFRELYYLPSYGSGLRVLPTNLADYFTPL